MTALTPNFNWPYPALTDDPDIPRDTQNLAVAIDTDVAAIQADVEALDVSASQLVAVQNRISNTGALGVGEATVSNTGVTALLANSLYRIEFVVRFATGTSGESFLCNIRKTNVSGLVLAGTVAPPLNSGGHGGGRVVAWYTTTATENTAFVGTIVLDTGSHNVVAAQPGTSIAAWLVGPSSLLQTT